MKHSVYLCLIIVLISSCLGSIVPPLGFKNGYYSSKALLVNNIPRYSSLEVKNGKMVLETACASLELDTIPGVSRKNTFSTFGKFIQRVPKNIETYYPPITTFRVKVDGYFKSENVVVIKIETNSIFSGEEFEFIYGLKREVLKCDDILD